MAFTDANLTKSSTDLLINMVDGIYGHQFKDGYIFFDEFAVMVEILNSSWDI